MISRKTIYTYLLILLGIFVLFSILVYQYALKRIDRVHIKDDTYVVLVANTDRRRSQGLSGNKGIKENEGMLFMFEENTKSGFWMIDMKYPLDILFIDENYTIVDIKQDFQPCSNKNECPVYMPNKLYRYAFEINGGLVEKRKYEIGDVVTITTSKS